MQYRSEIDGLRAIAVIVVILFHAGLGPLAGGYVGVDVFFVISGYLITSLILSQKSQGSFSLAHFYERRARRILPALYAVMTVAVVLGWVLLTPEQMLGFAKSVVAVSVFASNMLFWQESGYFDLDAGLKPLLHTWSLAVEEQFYLVLPLLLSLVWRLGRRSVVAVLAAVTLTSLGLAVFGAAGTPAAEFYLLPTRAWELLLGSLVAFVCDGREMRLPTAVLGKLLYQVAGIGGLAAIFHAVFRFDETTPFPSVYATVPTIGTVFVLLFAVPGTLLHAVLRHRLLRAVGLASYSAYLWHHVLFAFARLAFSGEPSPASYGGLILLVGLLSYLSWRYIETPFRAPGRISRVWVAGSATVMTGLFLMFGWAASNTGGFAELRTTAAQRQVLETSGTRRFPSELECNALGEPYLDPAADAGKPLGQATWATFGDSHIAPLGNALSEALRPGGIAVKQWGCNSCIPSFGVDAGVERCRVWTHAAAAKLVADPEIRNVVVTYRLTPWDQESNPVALDQLWRAYLDLLENFVASGKRVYVVLQPPELPARVDELIFKRRYAPDEIAGADRRTWEARMVADRHRLDVLPAGVVLIDPATIFCDANTCAAVQGGVALYYDNNHLSTRGAGFVVRRILEHAAGVQ